MMLTLLSLLVIAICVSWTTFGFLAIGAHRKKRVATLGYEHPGVTILKPLCGTDPSLVGNLESFFNQDYARFEIVFGIEGDQPALVAIVESLRLRYPGVSTKVVIHQGGSGLNPKVRNIRHMVDHAAHDLLLISDSNICAPPEYVQDAIDTFLDDTEHVGIVTNLFVGYGESTLGSALENVQLNGFCVAGAAIPTLLGDACVVGKSMLFSRRTLEKVGGFEKVSDVLAEDFVMGKMFQHAGYKVRLANVVLHNMTQNMPVRAFFDRHLRWAMLRIRLRPAAYVLEPLTSPLFALPFAWHMMGRDALLLVIALWFLRDVAQWLMLRGPHASLVPAVLAPVRDALSLLVWVCAPFKKHIVWRGTRVRLGAGTLLFHESEDR
jgi:ceramide glucosyltransferase